MFENQINWFKEVMETTNDKLRIELELKKFSLLFIYPNYEGRVLISYLFIFF